MRKLNMNHQIVEHINKEIMRTAYAKEMVKAFTEKFEEIDREGVDRLRTAFLESGKDAKCMTPEEYANLAVDVFNAIKAQR